MRLTSISISFRFARRTGLLWSVILAAVVSTGHAEEFDWHRFEVAGRPAFMILPEAEKRREPMPWVMYAPTFDKSLPNEAHEGWMFRRWLAAGIAIAGVDVGESFGNPAGRATYNALHEKLTTGSPPFAPRASLLARSRGGLMLYNSHPARDITCGAASSSANHSSLL